MIRERALGLKINLRDQPRVDVVRNQGPEMTKRMRLLVSLALAVAAFLNLANAGRCGEGNADRGARLFLGGCATCHANRGSDSRGPDLTDIVGGKPAVEGFNYSSAIRVYSWIWTVERLDEYLTDPAAVVRGATTASTVRDTKDRADIIAYLRTLRSVGSPSRR